MILPREMHRKHLTLEYNRSLVENKQVGDWRFTCISVSFKRNLCLKGGRVF